MARQADNPYQAPNAPVLATSDVATPRPMLYAPATWKFLLLAVITFNFYLIVWFYRNWIRLRRVQKIDIWPVPRAIFSPFTAYSCFERMEEVVAKRSGQREVKFHAGTLALIYFVLHAVGRLPAPFFLVSLLACLPVLAVNLKARAANQAAGDDLAKDDYLAWWSWMLIVLWAGFFALAMIGLTIPDRA
jgi:hypothetical protein